MGEEKLASFFLKVQAVEESFLRLEAKERSRALNILQSSVNKLLNFVGDADVVSASLCGSDATSSNKENAQKDEKGRKKEAQKKKRQSVKTKKKAANRSASGGFSGSKNSDRKISAESYYAADTANAQDADVQRGATTLPQQSGNPKHENKDNFDDDLQELADFDPSTYDFNPALQHTSADTVSRAGGSHMTQHGGKFAGKMLSMSVATSEGSICPTSAAQSQYQDQILEASTSHDNNSCEMSHSHYRGQILPGGSQEMKGSCHLSQYEAQQIMSASQMDSAAEASQFTGRVIDASGDHAQYAGGVIDSSGGPSQFAGGVIDSSGDPSQYAGNVIDTAGDATQYAGSVIDSTGETSQYAGGVIDMSMGQDVQNCNPSHPHAQYTGAMIPTAQDVTVCTTSQYAGAVLAMSMPETVSYSAAHYSHTVMQGVNGAATHPHFTDAVLDMSTAANRQCHNGIPASQYTGTIFEGAVLGAPVGAGCSPFQFRRPMFEPHEAFHRSQELTQSLMHASMLQQQQLYQLHQQTVTSRWRVFVCRGCGENLTHHRSVKAHLLSHGSSPLSCRFCRQRQVNHVALLHHLCGGQHWKESANVSREVYMCHECGKFFSSKVKLKSHFEGDHGVEMPQDVKFTCRFCGLQLDKKLSLFLHYRQHACGRFVCRKCGAILNDFVQYASHMTQHQKKKRKTCQQCGETFRCQQSFAKHIQTHAGHTCEKCQKTFLSAEALSKHQCRTRSARVKGKVMRSRTQDGQKPFEYTKGLEHHSYLPTGEKSLHCNQCYMSFRTSKALTKHRQTLGHCRRTGKSRENQHLCSECGKAYFRRQALQRHLRQHEHKKPYSCQYCNFHCSERDNLRRHAARHFSTQRNFICELCGAAFHAKKTLEMHHSYKHNAERRFKCPDCPMTFKARNALGRHSKTHSRTREHGCWCGAAFNRLYNLRRHMRLVHGSDDALPPIRRVEVLDLNQSVKQAVTAPPAKKMLVKTRKVKADCMQKEQEAAAAAVVVGGEEGEGGDGGGRMEREGVQVLPQVGMGGMASQDQQVGLEGVDSYSSMAAAASGGGVVGQANILHPLSHPPHPHLTMEQSYAMVSATLHHHHHHHNLHHDPQQTLIAATTGAEPAPIPSHPHPFPHLSHPAIDYSQLPSLSTMVPYSANIPTSNASTTTVTDVSAQRQDYYQPAGAGGMEATHQQAAEYTTSPFSFIQNFLLPSVGVANLLDLAHASGAK
ncbi:uncharacterized protein [Littorina saxatilis]|uniref:C2H2-type domain-containing protein n=1 Tax=Littorina saxatilis TaxID=31220 RepID=A0AAN9GQ56_9CAEN